MEQKNPRIPEQQPHSTDDTIKLLEQMSQKDKADRLAYAKRKKAAAQKKASLEKTQKKRKIIITVSSLLCILALTVGIVSAIGASNKGVTTAHPEADTSQTSVDKTAALQAVAEISKEPEPVDNKPKYRIDHQYKVNTKRLSKDIMKTLNEEISAEFVALYDVTADEFIYLKNGDKKCYPASTTKILTAIVASQIITDPQTVITVGDEISLIGEDSSVAYLEKGMQLTFEMLLDALMLPSGNDAAYTIAVNCARIYAKNPKLPNKDAVKLFMDLVNDAAQQMGASGTHYVTPDGWHDDDHYTSAIDLVKFGDYAKTVPLVAKSCSKDYAEWKLVKGGTLGWFNSNKLIRWDSGLYSQYCDGIKTGFTDQAGTSVVASATMNGHTFIVSVMNADNLYSKYEDCHKMFTYAFDLYDEKYTVG